MLRSAFDRLLLAKPKAAFIDDVINGLTVSRVNLLYGALARTKTMYISIGDHPALREYHDIVLGLDGEGVWKVEPQAMGGLERRPSP
jgi:putative ATP-binding cassette transporter